MATDRRRPDHDGGDPERVQLGRRRDERDADPLGLHLDHLRAQGLLGRAARRDHHVLGQSSGLPIFLGNLEVCTRVTEEMYGREVWQPGDVWILNDSYLAGTHLNDITVYGPIFHDGELVGFGASRAHWLDVGAKDAGAPMDSTEIYQEGLRLGPTKVVEGGRFGATSSTCSAETLASPTRRSATSTPRSRVRARASGALRRSSTGSASRRCSPRATRSSSRPSGSSARRSQRFPTASTRPRAASTTTASATSPVGSACASRSTGATRRSTSPSRTTARAARSTAARRRRSRPAASPTSCSSTRPAAERRRVPPAPVKVRQGSLLAAQEPSPCAWYFSPLGLLIDLVVKALAPVIPDLVAAASYGDSMIFGAVGVDPRTGARFFHIEPTVGGWGGWKGSDGRAALINSVNGAMKDFPIEILETKLPLRVAATRIRPDSGGAGKWRGGNGVVREFELSCDETHGLALVGTLADAGLGPLGRRPATPPDVVINPGRDDERQHLKATGSRSSAATSSAAPPAEEAVTATQLSATEPRLRRTSQTAT